MPLTGSINGEIATSDVPTTVLADDAGLILVRNGDTIHEVFVSNGEISDGNSIGPMPVEVESERARVIRERFSHVGGAVAGGHAAGAHAKIVKAPMPGMVKVVSVQVGDAVKKSTTVIILEAMKMENSITAGSDGVISKLNVSQGTSVEKNAPICEIEPH